MRNVHSDSNGEYTREPGMECPKEYTEQTNEEWFCGLSTEEKAKALHELHWEIQNYRDDHPSIEDDDVSDFYLKWLKEKHNEL